MLGYLGLKNNDPKKVEERKKQIELTKKYIEDIFQGKDVIIKKREDPYSIEKRKQELQAAQKYLSKFFENKNKVSGNENSKKNIKLDNGEKENMLLLILDTISDLNFFLSNINSSSKIDYFKNKLHFIIRVYYKNYKKYNMLYLLKYIKDLENYIGFDTILDIQIHESNIKNSLGILKDKIYSLLEKI